MEFIGEFLAEMFAEFFAALLWEMMPRWLRKAFLGALAVCVVLAVLYALRPWA
jgi:hypothetical protein